MTLASHTLPPSLPLSLSPSIFLLSLIRTQEVEPLHQNLRYSRRLNKVSVPFALHGEQSENSNITVEKNDVKNGCKTVLERCENGDKENRSRLRDHTCCPCGYRSIVCTLKTEEHLGSAKGATGKL